MRHPCQGFEENQALFRSCRKHPPAAGIPDNFSVVAEGVVGKNGQLEAALAFRLGMATAGGAAGLIERWQHIAHKTRRRHFCGHCLRGLRKLRGRRLRFRTQVPQDLALRIPDPDQPIHVTGSHSLTVGGDRHGEHHRQQLGHPSMLRGGRTLFARVRLELGISVNRPAIGGRPNRGTVARPSHGRDRRHGIAQRDDLLASGDIPDLELPVGPTADHLSGVGVESRGHHLGSVTFQHSDRRCLGHIPDLDERVTAG